MLRWLGWQGTNAPKAIGWGPKRQLGGKMRNIAGSRSIIYGFEDSSIGHGELEANASNT